LISKRWWLALAGAAICASVVFGYAFRWRWTGLIFDSAEGTRYKTAWDWLDLLIVPVALAALGFWFNSREKRTERERAVAVARSEALQSYLDRMSNLILDSNLLSSTEGSPERGVARSRTLTAASQLDSDGRGVVLQFLYEARLIGFLGESDPITGERERFFPIVRLLGADFRGANADGINLEGADLRGINMTGASLRGTRLGSAVLNGAKLREVDLRSGPPLYAASFTMSTDLNDANLRGADLTNANLDAILGDANLEYAKLKGANFGRSYISGTKLRGAELEGTNLRDVEEFDLGQLAFAGTLEGATLPGGSKGSQPHKLDLEISERSHMSGTGEPLQIAARVRAILNILPAGGADYLVGMTSYFKHEDDGQERPGLLVSSESNDERYVSDSNDSFTSTLRTGADTEATGLIDVPVRSLDYMRHRSVQLSCSVMLDARGVVRSASLRCVTVTEVGPRTGR
jgi:uncharacterized protein YjbI with pentapeptide repeats